MKRNNIEQYLGKIVEIMLMPDGHKMSGHLLRCEEDLMVLKDESGESMFAYPMIWGIRPLGNPQPSQSSSPSPAPAPASAPSPLPTPSPSQPPLTSEAVTVEPEPEKIPEPQPVKTEAESKPEQKPLQ